MEDKKWYWESLSMIHKQQTAYMSWFDEFIVVKRRDYIKLIHKKLHTKDLTYYNIKVIEHPFEINKSYYDLELCGDIQIITNIIKEKIRDIKLNQLGI
jgi:hypothetical protein